jgi:Flp pilus assembly protein TadD
MKQPPFFVAHRLMLSASVIACLMIAGCAARGSARTAAELIQQQREEQAQLQQQDDDSMRRSAATQPDLLISLIREAQDQGRYFAALAYTDAYIQKYGADAKVAALRADALRMTGQTERSEQAYRALISGGQPSRGWHGLGLLAGSRGDYPLAVENFQHAAALSPTDPQILSDLGFARLSEGDIAGARLPLGQAAELDPANPRVLSNFALLLLLEGDADAAQKVMDHAGVGDAARLKIFQLSASMRSSARAAHAIQPTQDVRAAGSGAPVAAVVSHTPSFKTPVRASDSPVVSSLPAPGTQAPPQTSNGAYSNAASGTTATPVFSSLMERFGSTEPLN